MFKYEIWFDSCCLHEDDDEFETQDDAKTEAIDWCFDRMEQWETDGVYDGETIDDFNIVIKEVA